MEQISIKAAARQQTGKSAARHLRARGQTPAVLYGRGRQPLPLAVETRQMTATLARGVYSTHVFDLHIDGGGAPPSPVAVMIREVQRHPINGTLLNIDFHAISLTEKVHAQVPLLLKGEPAGLRKGGILERLHTEITVSCLPTQIPDHIEVDISSLDIGDSIHVKDLTLPEGIELLTSPEEILVLLAPPAKVVEEVPAAPAEAPEPEVLTQKEGAPPGPEETE